MATEMATDMAEIQAAPAGSMHSFPVRVYYEDTDNGGVVYYANYLKFAERARTEMLRSVGIDHGGLIERDGIAFAVKNCEIEYLAPARLDDMLEIQTGNLDIRGASLWADQVVMRGGEALVRIRLRLVCIASDGRTVRLPEDLRRALAPLAAKTCEGP